MADLDRLDSSELDQLAQDAVQLAADILSASRANETSEERVRSAMMARMMNDIPVSYTHLTLPTKA